MNEGKELIKALDDIEKEKGISKDILLEAIENSLVAACKNEYGKADNIRVTMNRETGEVKVFADKTVVEEVEDPEMEISVADARLKNKSMIRAILFMWRSYRRISDVLQHRRQNRSLSRRFVKKKESLYIMNIMVARKTS